MATIKGADRHSRRLRNISGIRLIGEMGKRVFALAEYGRVEAAHSITQGSVSGKNHVPSAPGEPPNRDTGELDSSIVSRKTGPTSAEYAATADYALPLEVGSSKMAERPYMRPSAKKVREKAGEIVGAGVSTVIKGS